MQFSGCGGGNEAMKLKTNFIVPPGRWVWPITVASTLGALGLVLLTTSLMLHRAELESALAVQRERLEQLQRTQSELKAPVLPAPERTERVRERIAVMNALSQTGSRPIGEVLDVLEAPLPGKAHLVRFGFERGNRTFQLTLEAPGVKALRKFFQQLEETGLFDDLQVVQQNEVQYAAGKALRAELRFSEKAGVTAGKGKSG